MPDPNLSRRLRELHDELSAINTDLQATEQVDDQTVDALGQLVSDVSGLVDRAQSKSEQDPETELTHDMAGRIAQFQSDHPRVTKFLSELTDALGMMGI